MRWLLVGALGAETLPFARRVTAARPVTPRLVVGTWRGLELGVLTCGVGPGKAHRRTRAALAAWRPHAVASVGTAGALVDGLPVGSVLCAERVLWGAVDRSLPTLPGLPVTTVITVETPCWTAAERERLAATGASLVEMEAGAVAAACPGLPVVAIKIVSDLAGGAPDPAGGQGGPRPAAVARFLARAAALVEDSLADAVLSRLPDAPPS